MLSANISFQKSANIIYVPVQAYFSLLKSFYLYDKNQLIFVKSLFYLFSIAPDEKLKQTQF